MDETMIAQQLERVEQRCEANTTQIKDLKKRQDNLDKLVASMAKMEEKQASMDSDLKEIKTDVKALTDKPGKRWEHLVATVISVIVGAVLGVILARLGMG